VEEACHSESLDVLKKLKLDAGRDDFPKLLQCAAVSSRKAVLEYLLGIGANPNDKPNGGSSSLETALWHLNFARFDPYGSKRLKSKYDVSSDLDCVRALLAHGAIWNPDDAYHVSSLRRTLLEYEPNVTIELLQMFRTNRACPAERVHRLLGTPRMKDHLQSEHNALVRLGICLDAGPRGSRRRPPGRA
jgi:hypothetical protein